MGYQFVHLEMYSRKGREGRGTAWVIDEAERKPGSCTHVPSPKDPEIVFGMTIDAVRAEHDRRAADAETTTRTGHTRAIRRDQHSLLTVVASHPSAMSDARPEIRQAVAEWEARTVAWLRVQFGDALVSVVRHADEPHPHLHAFVLPQDPEMRASVLHPGAKAKADAMATPVPGEERKHANKRGDAAYRQAMRAWQDSYWQAVGLPCGLSRLGPSRRRLSRQAWQAEQSAQAASRTAQADAAKVVAAVQKAVVKAEASVRASENARVNAMRDALNARRSTSALISAAEMKAEIIEQKARRLCRFGSRIRMLWDGLRRSVIREQLEANIRNSSAEQIVALGEQIDRATEAERSERQRRLQAEAMLGHMHRSFERLGLERDRLRSIVARFQTRTPMPSVGPQPRI